jgi:hypothetical protein
MNVKMKVLDHPMLLKLNESSRGAGRKQNIQPEQLSVERRKQYIVNFHLDHKFGDREDVRLSVILKPGALSAWLDVSPEEYAAIPDVEMTELEWEAAVCVGMPRSME